jgi:hypothetical protein
MRRAMEVSFGANRVWCKADDLARSAAGQRGAETRNFGGEFAETSAR